MVPLLEALITSYISVWAVRFSFNLIIFPLHF